MSDSDLKNSGALPSLDNDAAVLGVPSSKAKSKTNVGKFGILSIFVIGFLFIVVGLLVFQKNRRANAPTEVSEKQEKPGFAQKNAALENDSIEATKAAIKKQQDEEAAAKKLAAEEAEREKAKAQADALAEALAAARRPQAAAAPGMAPVAVAEPPTPEERKQTGSVLLDSSGAKLLAGAQPDKDLQQRELARVSGGNGGGGASTPAGYAGSADLGNRLQPTVLNARRAGKLPNLDFLLKKGTIIPCALKTGIDTTVPGFVICNVLSDVYSANRKTLLIERGASVFGEQQSQPKQGQERTFVVWTRIDNPSGVYADIDSPATDQMGYSGLPGYVDNHFWQRFGGAIMLSFIKDFSQSITQRSNTVSGGPQYSNSSQTAQDMAAEALRNSINIPPTLTVLPGTVVNVLLARDVNFQDVYSTVE